MSCYQVEFVTIDSLVDKNHQYRKFKKLWDLSSTKKELSQHYLKYLIFLKNN